MSVCPTYDLLFGGESGTKKGDRDSELPTYVGHHIQRLFNTDGFG